MNTKAAKKKNQVTAANIFEQQEMIAKVEAIRSHLKASTWLERVVLIAISEPTSSLLQVTSP